MITTRWAFNTSQWVNTAENWRHCLSAIQPEEVQRISEFVYSNSAVSSLVGRLLLRRWAAKCQGLHGSAAQFVRSEKGRPELVLRNELPGHDVDVNISHQGSWVVLAAGKQCKVGIDVMKVQYCGGKSTSEFFRLMKRQFTTEEWNTISTKEDEWSQLASFYRHWCLKEAFVKALGVGIGYDLQKISFKLSTPKLERNLVVQDTTVSAEGLRDQDWNFEEYLLDDEHSCAIAYLPNLPFNASKSKTKASPDASALSSFEMLSLLDILADLTEFSAVSDEVVQLCTEKEFASWLS